MLDARLLSMPDRSTSELLRTLSMNGCFQANILAVLAIQPRLIQLSIYSGTLADDLGSFPLGPGP